MRISQTLATQIAKELTANRLQEIEKLGNEISALVRAEYKKTIPQTVLRLFAKEPSYFRKTTSLRLYGNGFSGKPVSFKEALPDSDSDKWETILNVDTELGKKLAALVNKREKMVEERETLRKEIESALLTLRSFKAIQDNFPEAIPFLPKSNSAALIPNLTGIRKKLVA